MNDLEMQDYLKPIYSTVERLVPTNKQLMNFVNDKAMGEGLKRALYKVKFIEKSERSSKQLADLTLTNFKKHLSTRKNLSDEDRDNLIEAATNIMEDAHQQIEEVYGEIRTHVIINEVRTGCIDKNYRRIDSLNDLQNDILSKEIFTLAMKEFDKRDDVNHHALLESEFIKINDIAFRLFRVIAAAEGL